MKVRLAFPLVLICAQLNLLSQICWAQTPVWTHTYTDANGQKFTFDGLTCNTSASSCTDFHENATHKEYFQTLLDKALNEGGYASMFVAGGCANYISLKLQTTCSDRFCWAKDVYKEVSGPSGTCITNHVETCSLGCKDGQCFTEVPSVQCKAEIIGHKQGRSIIRWSAKVVAGNPANSQCVDAESCCPTSDPSLPSPCGFFWSDPDSTQPENPVSTMPSFDFEWAYPGNTYRRKVRLAYHHAFSAEAVCSISIPDSPPPTPVVYITPVAAYPSIVLIE